MTKNKLKLIKKTGRNKALKSRRVEIRISESEYRYLQEQAELRENTITNFIKNCVKHYMQFDKKYEGWNSTGVLVCKRRFKSKRIELRLTELEYQRLQKSVIEKGMILSHFIRMCIEVYKNFGPKHKSWADYYEY